MNKAQNCKWTSILNPHCFRFRPINSLGVLGKFIASSSYCPFPGELSAISFSGKIRFSTAKAALIISLSSMGKTTSRGDAASRAERKFEKKLEFYSKAKQTVASLAAQKAIAKKKKVRSRQKKLKAYDLSTLTEFLPNLKASQQPKPAEFKLKSKTRNNLVLKEGNQLQAVLTHPAFQSDPLGAIHQHLQSTQPTVDEKPKLREKKNGNRKGKKRSKASTGLQSMET